LELNDYLIEAEKKLDSGDVEGAKALVERAVSGCKDLIASESGDFFSLVNVKEWKNPVLVVISIAFLVSLFVIYLVLKMRIGLSKRLYKSKKERKGFFSFLKFGKKSKKRKSTSSKKDVWK
jgi:hypothetical protein